LQQVLGGRSTLDDCLAQNPEHAELLRPLLQTALQIDRLDRPQASRSGFQAGQQLMMDALARKEEKRALSCLPQQGILRRWSSFRHARSGEGLAVTRLAAVSVLGAATALIWLAAAGLMLRLWNGALLPQTCLVADASGVAQVQSARGAVWQTLVAGWELQAGHRIRTGDPASATLHFAGGGSTSIGPDTELEVVQLAVRRDGRGQVIVLRQASGSTHSLVESLADSTTLYEIRTSAASVVAHGTEFFVLVSADGSTSIVVLEGAVSVTGRETTATLTGGQAIIVGVGEEPGPVVAASPEDFVESPSPESRPEGSQVATATREMATSTATLGPASPPATPQVATATLTPGPPGPTPTATPEPPGATATSKPLRPTATTEPSNPTATPRPPTPTRTAEPPSPTPTSEPSPTLEPIEIVDVFYAYYTEDEEKLWVKARTSRVECTLTLQGFGAMEAEGDHWVYVEESLAAKAVPATVTVRSSCGGSGSRVVQWR
jgi:hypothetical protein